MLFLILELAALLMVISNNNYQNAKFNTWSLATMGGVYERQSEMKDYFSLKNTNEELAQENAILKELIIKGSSIHNTSFLSIQDPFAEKEIDFTPAKVVNASTNQQHNIFTINVGKCDSIDIDMAVVGPNGIVGVIKSVSDHYSLVLPVINIEYRVSSKLKKSNNFGTLNWDTKNYRFATLEGIERHVDIAIGDTVTTSGYGAIFPEGIMVGTVDNIEEGEEGVFHDLHIKLSTDFNRTTYVYVIKNNTKQERLDLESTLKK